MSPLEDHALQEQKDQVGGGKQKRAGSFIGTGGTRGRVISRKSTRLSPFSRMVNMIRYKAEAEDNFVETSNACR